MKQESGIKNQESGVTLLLAVLVLAGLTLITLAVGSFAIQELRSSRAIVATEPGIAAAESAGEQGLWAIKRNTAMTTCPTQASQTLTNGAMINSCKSFGAATFNIVHNIPQSFYLYDPNNPNGDTDLLAYPYSNMTITHVSGTFQVNMTVTRLDGSTTGLAPSSGSISPGGSQVVNISPVSAGSEGRIKVTLTSAGDITVSANTDKGMPNFPTIDAIGCSNLTAAVTNCNTTSQEVFSRRINITVPQ